jgi:hypothetical protein
MSKNHVFKPAKESDIDRIIDRIRDLAHRAITERDALVMAQEQGDEMCMDLDDFITQVVIMAQSIENDLYIATHEGGGE